MILCCIYLWPRFSTNEIKENNTRHIRIREGKSFGVIPLASVNKDGRTVAYRTCDLLRGLKKSYFMAVLYGVFITVVCLWACRTDFLVECVVIGEASVEYICCLTRHLKRVSPERGCLPLLRMSWGTLVCPYDYRDQTGVDLVFSVRNRHSYIYVEWI